MTLAPAPAMRCASWGFSVTVRSHETLDCVRPLRWLIGAYLLVALSVRLVEAAGGVRCECDEACWCKRPMLSTFRWVFPFGHR